MGFLLVSFGYAIPDSHLSSNEEDVSELSTIRPVFEFNESSSLFSDIKETLREIEALEELLKKFDRTTVEKDGKSGYKFKDGVSVRDDEALRSFEHLQAVIEAAKPKMKTQLSRMEQIEDKVGEDDKSLFDDTKKRLETYLKNDPAQSTERQVPKLDKQKSSIPFDVFNLLGKGTKLLAEKPLQCLQNIIDRLGSGLELCFDLGIKEIRGKLDRIKETGIQISQLKGDENRAERDKLNQLRERLLHELEDFKLTFPKPNTPIEKIWKENLGVEHFNELSSLLTEFEMERSNILKADKRLKDIETKITENNDPKEQVLSAIQSFRDDILNHVESSNVIGPSLGVKYEEALSRLNQFETRIKESDSKFVGPPRPLTSGTASSSASSHSSTSSGTASNSISSTTETPSTPATGSSARTQDISKPSQSASKSGTQNPRSSTVGNSSNTGSNNPPPSSTSSNSSSPQQTRDRVSDSSGAGGTGNQAHAADSSNLGTQQGQGAFGNGSKLGQYDPNRKTTDFDKSFQSKKSDDKNPRLSKKGDESDSKKGNSGSGEEFNTDKNGFVGMNSLASSKVDLTNSRPLAEKGFFSNKSSSGSSIKKEQESVTQNGEEAKTAVESDKSATAEGGASDELGFSPRNDKKKNKGKAGAVKSATRDPLDYNSGSIAGSNVIAFPVNYGMNNPISQPSNLAEKYVPNSDGTFSLASGRGQDGKMNSGRKSGAQYGIATDGTGQIQGSFEELDKIVKEDMSSAELTKLALENGSTPEDSLLEKLGLKSKMDSIYKFLEDLTVEPSTNTTGDVTDLLNTKKASLGSGEDRRPASRLKETIVGAAAAKNLARTNPSLWNRLLSWLGIN